MEENKRQYLSNSGRKVAQELAALGSLDFFF